MPLKYMAGKPMAVSIIGAIHGALFILYCAALWHAMTLHTKPLKWTVKYFVAALVPRPVLGGWLAKTRIE